MSREAKTRLRDSVLFSWSLSYLFIMLIPIVFSGIVYYKTVGIIRLDITETNFAALKQIQQTLDNHLNEIEQLSLRININPRLSALMELFSENGKRENLFSSYAMVKNVLDMNSELSVYSLANRFIKDFFIVFRDGDFVWSSNSIFDKRTFFRQSIFSAKLTYEDWLAMLDRRYVSTYVYDGAIMFFQSLPIGNPTVKANLVIVLDEEKIRGLMLNAGWYSRNTIYILDQDEKVLLSTTKGGEPEVPKIGYSAMPGNYGILSAAQGMKGEYAVSYITSSQARWKYVCAVPDSVFSEKVRYVRNLTLLGLLLCACLEVAAAFYFIRRNYNPLNMVVGYLMNISGLLYPRRKNEFSFIQDSIHRVYEEKEMATRELSRQNAVIRANIVLKLMKGRYGDQAPVLDLLKEHGIDFEGEFFLVALLSPEDEVGSSPDGPEATEEERSRAFQRMLEDLLRNPADGVYKAYVTEVDELVGILFNFKEKPPADWKQALDETFRSLVDVPDGGAAGGTCTISVGGVHETLKGIPLAYREALDALEYQLFAWSSRVIYYDDIREAQRGNFNYSYTIETEQKLIAGIVNGDFEQSLGLLNGVFDENFSSGLAGVQLARCLMVDLVGSFIKALNGRGILKGLQILEDKKLIHELYECRTLEEIRRKLVGFLKEICEYAREYKNKHVNDKAVNKIVAAVGAHYHDVNLNVARLADLLDMNPKYLSYVYKEATGDSLINLINRTRIDRAKDFLKEDLSILATARRVGYGNSNAFIRIFKKYEGITPGRFKEIN